MLSGTQETTEIMTYPLCSFVAYYVDILVDGCVKTIVSSLDQLYSQVILLSLYWICPICSPLNTCCIIDFDLYLIEDYKCLHYYHTFLQISFDNITKNNISPMLEVQLELSDSCVEWVPEMLAEDANSDSVPGLMLKWVNSFFEVDKLIQQMDYDQGSTLLPISCYFCSLTPSTSVPTCSCRHVCQSDGGCAHSPGARPRAARNARIGRTMHCLHAAVYRLLTSVAGRHAVFAAEYFEQRL